jgi:hypothetical protein
LENTETCTGVTYYALVEITISRNIEKYENATKTYEYVIPSAALLKNRVA